MDKERGWFIPTLQFGRDDVFLFEDWEETPVGPYRALFHFTPEDFRTLYASSEEGRDYVSTVHRFDRKEVAEIASRRGEERWEIEVDTGEKGRLRIEVDFVETPMLKLINPVAARVPERIASRPLYCRLLPRLAAPLAGTDPNQRIAGTTELGRKTRFRLERIFKVTGGRCLWDGRDLGPLQECSYAHDMGDYRPASKPVVCYLYLFLE